MRFRSQKGPCPDENSDGSCLVVFWSLFDKMSPAGKKLCRKNLTKKQSYDNKDESLRLTEPSAGIVTNEIVSNTLPLSVGYPIPAGRGLKKVHCKETAEGFLCKCLMQPSDHQSWSKYSCLTLPASSFLTHKRQGSRDRSYLIERDNVPLAP